MHGSEFIAKDVLEYIVFERYLTMEYGSWRIHAKIIPVWQAPREPSATTTVKQPEMEDDEGKKVDVRIKKLSAVPARESTEKQL